MDKIIKESNINTVRLEDFSSVALTSNIEGQPDVPVDVPSTRLAGSGLPQAEGRVSNTAHLRIVVEDPDGEDTMLRVKRAFGLSHQPAQGTVKI